MSSPLRRSIDANAGFGFLVFPSQAKRTIIKRVIINTVGLKILVILKK
jgi:hypothetical protein